MVSRRKILKYLGASIIGLGLTSLPSNSNIDNITVVESFSGNIQTLYNNRALALLERDIKSADTFEGIIGRLHDSKVKNDSVLNEIREELIRTTVAYSKRFDRDSASDSEIARFLSKINPKKESFGERLAGLTGFIVYQDGERFVLSSSGECFFLTQEDIETLNRYIPKRKRLEEKVNYESSIQRPGVASTIHNSAPYLNTVYNVSCQENMDLEELLTILAIESKGDTYAVSYVGALGQWQIMPYVAKSFWEKYPEKFRADSEEELMGNILRYPELSTRLAVAILKENGYPKRISIAAYNSGMEKVRNFDRHQLNEHDYFEDFNIVLKAIERKKYLS